MPGGVGQPGLVGEKVKIPHYQLHNVCQCTYNGGLCVWACAFVVCFYLAASFLFSRVRTEKLETLEQLESLALL